MVRLGEPPEDHSRFQSARHRDVAHGAGGGRHASHRRAVPVERPARGHGRRVPHLWRGSNGGVTGGP
eukprot:3097123-Pyramimonas_sp.AAC.1